jgi:hypothetical protein
MHDVSRAVDGVAHRCSRGLRRRHEKEAEDQCSRYACIAVSVVGASVLNYVVMGATPIRACDVQAGYET